VTDQVLQQLLWEPLLPGWALGLTALLAVFILALAWRGSAGVPRRRRLALLGLRALGLLALAVVFGGPTHVQTRGRATRDPFVVLVDASRSMRVVDGEGTRSERVGQWLADASEGFAELSERFEVRYLLVDGALRGWGVGGDEGRGALGGGGPGSGEPSPADGGQTDLAAGLFALRDTLDGVRPAGILLATDGADRGALGRAFEQGGEEALAQMLEPLGVPVSTWAVGEPDGPPDLSIHRVHAPPFGFVRRPLVVEVDVSSRQLPAGDHRVRLIHEGELVGVALARVGDDGAATVTFEVKPDRVGYHTYTVGVPVPPGDAIPSNNRYEFTVKVVRDRTRILQVTSRPSWDVKFLRRLLKTDPNVDLVSFFILRHRAFQGRLSREEELSLIAFPYEELFSQDLQGFDVVIFQNFWFGSFANFSDTPFLENVAKYVEEGGALLMVGGDQSLGAVGYGASPLGPVLPAEVPREPLREGRFAPIPTAAGLRHPITRLARDEQTNASRWAELPDVDGLNVLGSPLEGGVELLTAGPDGPPLAVARQVGRGRALAFASPGSWRWALAGRQGPGAGHDHAEFWRNAVRWLVQDAEQRQVQVLTDRENYRLGDKIQVQVRALQDDFAPLADAPIALSMDALDGGAPNISQGTTDADGQFALTFEAAREGTLRLIATVDGIPEPFGLAEARVSVNDREGELEEPGVRQDLLAALADATGGKSWTEAPDPLDAPTRPSHQLRAVDRTVEPAWARGPWLLLLVLPFGAEWILRRRSGLS
jgi:uncharacterized membrane protein